MTDSNIGGAGRKKRRAGDLGPLPWLAAALVTLVVAGGSWWMITSGEERAAQQLVAAREIRSAMEGLLGREGEAKIDPAPRSTGAAGAIERACKEFLAQVNADTKAEDDAMNALKFEEVLKDANLGAPDGVARARAAVARGRAIVAEHRKLRRKRINAFHERVGAVSMPASEKAALLGRFEGALEASPMASDRVWLVKDEILGAIDANLILLDNSRGRWSLRNRRLSFDNEPDRIAYNKNVYRANTAEWELRRLLERTTELARKRLIDG